VTARGPSNDGALLAGGAPATTSVKAFVAHGAPLPDLPPPSVHERRREVNQLRDLAHRVCTDDTCRKESEGESSRGIQAREHAPETGVGERGSGDRDLREQDEAILVDGYFGVK
jgi:hypothetical protein